MVAILCGRVGSEGDRHRHICMCLVTYWTGVELKGYGLRLLNSAEGMDGLPSTMHAGIVCIVAAIHWGLPQWEMMVE